MRFALDSLFVFLARLVSRGAVFVVLVILARGLSIEDLGYYGIVTTTAYSAVYFGSLGLRHASALYLGREMASVGAVVGALALASTVLGLVAGVGASLAYWYLGARSGDTLLAVLSGAVLLPMLFVFIWQGYFLGFKQIKRFNRSELVSRFLLLVLVLVVFLAGVEFSVQGALLAFLVSQLVGMTYVVATVSRSVTGPLIFAGSGRTILDMVRSGFPFAVSLALVILSPTISLHIGTLVAGAQVAGLFFVAYKLTDIIAEAATATGMVAFSYGVQKSRPRRALGSALRSAWVVVGISIVLAVILSLSSDLITRLLLGEEYADSAVAIDILVWSLPFLCFSRILSPALAAQGHAATGAWIQAGTVAMNACGALVLGSQFGLVGIALALALSRVINAFAFAVNVSRFTGLGFARVVIPNRRASKVFFGRLGRALRKSLARRRERIR